MTNTVSDLTAAARGLVRTGQASDFDAALRIVAGHDLTAFSGVIAEERAAMQQEAEAQQRAAWESSPEGRAAKAVAVLAAREEEAKRDRLARALLEDEGQFSTEDLDLLTADERAKAAGLVLADTPADTIDTNLAAISPEDREWLKAGGQLG